MPVNRQFSVVDNIIQFSKVSGKLMVLGEAILLFQDASNLEGPGYGGLANKDDRDLAGGVEQQREDSSGFD